MAILTSGRALLHFSVTAFAGLMCPIFAKFCNLAGAFVMAFFTVLEYLLMFLVWKRDLARGCWQVNNVGGGGCSGKCKQSDQCYNGFRHLFSSLIFIVFNAFGLNRFLAACLEE
jgi:hypothetical protein